MNTLIKQKISTSPHIELHPNGRFLFDGSSLIIDAAEFYSDIMIWISDYYREPAEKTIVDIRISTTNSSSDSMLQKIFYTLNRLHKTKKTEVSYIWHYDLDDSNQLLFIESVEKYADAIHFILEPNNNGVSN